MANSDLKKQDTEVSDNKWQQIYLDLPSDDQEYFQAVDMKLTRLQENWSIAMGKILTDVKNRLSNHKSGTYAAWLKAHHFPRKSAFNIVRRYEFYLELKGKENGDQEAANLLTLPLTVQDSLASHKVDGALAKYTLQNITSTKEFQRLSKAYSEAKADAADAQKKLVEQKSKLDDLRSQNLETLQQNSSLNDQLRQATQQIKDQSIRVEELTEQLSNPDMIPDAPDNVNELRQEIDEDEQYIDKLVKEIKDLKNNPVVQAPDDYEDLKADNAALRKQIEDIKDYQNIDPQAVTAFKNVVDQSVKANDAIQTLSQFALSSDLRSLSADQISQTSIPGMVDALHDIEQALTNRLHGQIIDGEVINN